MTGTYLLLLLGCLLCTLPLEIFLKTGVYRRWRRLLLTMAPVVPVFVAWDLLAISRGQWSFNPSFVTGVVLPGGLPIEELLFFLVVPVCAVLTLEAVRQVKAGRPGWDIGDEAGSRTGTDDAAAARRSAGS